MYSQNNEEAVILEALAGTPKGRFLDIGAYDGKTFSNTLRLAELGWSGVCVEPSPTVFPALLKLHGNNPDIMLVNCAVGVSDDWLEFYDANGDAVSSSDVVHVGKWSTGNVKFTKFMLRALPVDLLFKTFGVDYTFINLDVESLNWALFQMIPWEQLKNLKVICVEHDGHHDAMAAVALKHGFKKIGFNGENLILAR